MKYTAVLFFFMSICSANCLKHYDRKIQKYDGYLGVVRGGTINGGLFSSGTALSLQAMGKLSSEFLVTQGAGLILVGGTWIYLGLKRQSYNFVRELIRESEEGEGKYTRKLLKRLNAASSFPIIGDNLRDVIYRLNQNDYFCTYNYKKEKRKLFKIRNLQKYLLKNLKQLQLTQYSSLP